MRICSLLPSATEIVAELDLVESLVGISEECDWPPEVRDLPIVTASRVDTTRLTGLEIDKAVRAALGDGRPLYAIDRELLEAIRPDLILTQNLCAVCAVAADHVSELCATDAEVVALDAHTLTEIEGRILSLADLLSVSARGRSVVAEMEAKIAAVRACVADAPSRSVFVAEWLEPPYAAGHWIPEMVAIAGGRDVLGQAGAPSYPTSWETVSEVRRLGGCRKDLCADHGATPWNAPRVTDTYFCRPHEPRARQSPFVAAQGVIGAAPTPADSSPSGSCVAGVAVGTLNPMNPYRTSRIGLARLKKQYGKYDAVETPSTPEM
jgi:iron complex transport system substrate-binding protein